MERALDGFDFPFFLFATFAAPSLPDVRICPWPRCRLPLALFPFAPTDCDVDRSLRTNRPGLLGLEPPALAGLAKALAILSGCDARRSCRRHASDLGRPAQGSRRRRSSDRL